MSKKAPRHLWAVVLAAGNGRRVSALTSGETGRPVPKQYCALGGYKTMLRWALDRAAGLVRPSQILVVVAEQHRELWWRELAGLPPNNVFIQPRDRGTAAALLLPFLDVFLRRDRRARVLVLPSDHHVAEEEMLREALLVALQALRLDDNRVVLFGSVPRGDDADYGWIMPAGATAGSLANVSGFVEKPDPETARDLVGVGALVNTFILAANASGVLRLYEETVPGILRMFLQYLHAALEPEQLDGLYELLPSADLARDVLERAAKCLAVFSLPDCGWADLGTPGRLERFLGRAMAGQGPGRALGAGLRSAG